MSDTLVVDVPRALWLTSNRPITHHGQRSRLVAQLHRTVALAAIGQRLTRHDGPVHATWTIRYPKGTGWTHGDAANAHPTCKALLDGLVLEKYLEGDGPRFVRAETYTRGDNLVRGDGWHTVTLELAPARAHGAEPDRMRALYTERWGTP